jgi:extracellular matrix regulatory protein A
MEQSLLNIGFGSTVVAERVIAIVSPNSAPMKRLKDEAKEEKRLVDATHGRKTRSIIITDSNHVILSAIQAETISQRYEMLKETDKTVRYDKKQIIDDNIDESHD